METERPVRKLLQSPRQETAVAGNVGIACRGDEKWSGSGPTLKQS